MLKGLFTNCDIWLAVSYALWIVMGATCGTGNAHFFRNTWLHSLSGVHDFTNSLYTHGWIAWISRSALSWTYFITLLTLSHPYLSICIHMLLHSDVTLQGGRWNTYHIDDLHESQTCPPIADIYGTPISSLYASNMDSRDEMGRILDVDYLFHRCVHAAAVMIRELDIQQDRKALRLRLLLDGITISKRAGLSRLRMYVDGVLLFEYLIIIEFSWVYLHAQENNTYYQNIIKQITMMHGNLCVCHIYIYICYLRASLCVCVYVMSTYQYFSIEWVGLCVCHVNLSIFQLQAGWSMPMSCVPILILVYVFVYAYVMCTYPYFSICVCLCLCHVYLSIF